MRAELLAELGKQHDELTEKIASHAARAQASRDAIAALDAERIQLLAAGQDAAPLRPRRADAEADLADSETAGELVSAQLAAVDQRIAEVRQEQADAERQAERDQAAALGARLAPRAAAALRAAVLGDGTVRALADLGGQLAQAEAVSGRSWDAEVVPPVLPGSGGRDDWHRAVHGLWQAARAGNVAACQRAVPACVPWQDRDPAEMAVLEAEVRANADRLSRLALENQARIRQNTHGGQPMVPQLPNPLPGALVSGRTGW